MFDLHAYLDRLERHKAEKHRALTHDDIRDIAIELGWSPSELAELESLAQEHRERGRNFAERALWDDAIVELGEAMRLAPPDLALLWQLADAHAGRWQARQSVLDRDEARRLAREALALDPGFQPAYDLLAKLAAPDAIAHMPAPEEPKDPQQLKSARLIPVALVCATLVVGLVAFVANQQMGSERFLQTPPPVPSLPQDRAPMPAPVLSAEPVASAGRSVGKRGKREVPVALVEAKGLQFALEPRLSRHSQYAEKAYYSYALLLINRTDREFKELAGRVELLDASGTVLRVVQEDFWQSYQGRLRPGDAAPVEGTVECPAEVTGARLLIETHEDLPAPRDYPPAKAVQIVWDVPKPPGVELAAFQREQRDDQPTAKPGETFFQATWEVRNTGEKALELLQIKVALHDANAQLVAQSTPYVVSVASPYLAGGEHRLVSTIDTIRKPVARYRLHVVDVR